MSELFDFSFSNFSLPPGCVVVLGVSGGSDSMALLFLMWNHAKRNQIRIIAATVDHGLRPESAQEARFVADVCANLGVEHRILSWNGQKPRTRILEAARVARYHLLANLAESEQACMVMIGHTFEDHTETIIMRKMRGDNYYGLAGIPPATLFDMRIWFCRPLLAFTRQDLRLCLLEKQVSWIEDPTNLNLLRERNKLRAVLSESRDGLEKRYQAYRLGKECSQKRVSLLKKATDIIKHYVCLVSVGLILLDRNAFSYDDEALLHVFRVLTALSGGAKFLPNIEQSRTLLEHVLKRNGRVTLARSLVDSRKQGIFFLREERSLPPIPSPSFGAFWDRRYRFFSDYSFSSPSLCRSNCIPSSLKEAAIRTFPTSWQNYGQIVPVLSPWVDFLPVFDFHLACAISSLFGLFPLPCAPFHDENSYK